MTQPSEPPRRSLSAAEKSRRLGECLRSFPKFCGLLKVVDFESGARVPFRLTPIQRAYAQRRTLRDIVLKPRKVFMTTLEAARDLYLFLTQPGARVVAVVQSQKKHETLREISRMVDLFLDSLRHQGLDFELGTEAEGRWTFPEHDATFEILEAGASLRTAQKTGRGTAITRLHLSEVASYEHGAETIAALVGAMPKTGEVTIESTPNGSSGYFFDQWQLAANGDARTAFEPHFFPWYLHDLYSTPLSPGERVVPEGRLFDVEARLLGRGVAPERIKWYREQLAAFGGDVEKLKQEYASDPETCFLASGDQYVPTALIEQCLWYDEMPRLGPEFYSFAGIDFGRTNDLTVIFTLRHDQRSHLWNLDTRTCRRTDWTTQMREIFAAASDWGWRKVAVDRTGLGSMPAELIEEALGRQRVELVDFGENSKDLLATTLYAAIAERRVSFPDDPDLVRDLKAIKRLVSEKGRVSYDAPRTKDGHADRAWAAALALHAAGVRPPAPPRREFGYGDYSNA